jgi:two-component system, OmpR family, sensor kinase
MKFLTRINNNFLKLFALILVFVTVAGFLVLHAVIIRNTKENLLTREFHIIQQISATGEIPNLHPVIEVEQATDTLPVVLFFGTSEIWNESEKENETFIELTDKVKIDNKFYIIKLRQSTFENEDLILILALTLFIFLSSAFLIIFIVSRKLNKTVWADFEKNLHSIESFRFNQDVSISLLKSDIDEFERLNNAVITLTEKLKTDYLSLKEFTENASHEIQTPITIALLNLEEALQQNLDQVSLNKIITTINAIKRLSSLNQSLTLLTKIENRQFVSHEEINIRETLTYYLSEFEPLFELKKINVDLKVEDDFTVKINNQLAGILISNLMSNSINHNINNGLVEISLKKNSLSICNTGPENELSEETIFNRFVKGKSKSFGLGLAIVKKICETNNLEIHYSKNDLHCFTISPNP